MTTLRNIIAGVAIVTMAGACAPAGNSFTSTPSARDSKAPTVAVENNNWATMTVYVLRGTSRVRLGTVNSMSTEVFRIPRTVMASARDLHLVADPIGSSNTFVSPALHVSPGERVEFTIENHLAISSVSVWRRE